MQRTSRFGAVAFSILLAVFGAGCSQEDEPAAVGTTDSPPRVRQAEGGDGVYRLPLLLNPSSLDPVQLYDQYGISVATQVFEGLVQFGPYLSIHPAVAKNWQITDNGRTVRFFLRPHVLFHNGREVGAADVVFSLQRLVRAEPAPSILPHLLIIEGAQDYRERKSETISGVRALDAASVELRLSRPYAPLLSALAMYQAAVVPADVLRDPDNRMQTEVIGCGPFRLVQWLPNRMIRLERFDDYYAGPAYLEAVEYRLYPDGRLDRVLEDFKAGLLQEMPVYADVLDKLSGEEELRWERRPSLGLLFYGIKVNHPNLQDVRLRRALSLAIDRRKLVETVYKGQFEPAYSILPPGMPAYSKENPVVEEDLQRARQLIEAIRSDRPDFEPVVEVASASNSALAHAELDFVRQAWRAIGVEMERKIVSDWPAYEAYLRSDEAQIYRFSWTADMPDPDNVLSPMFQTSSLVNHTGAGTPAIDELLEQARTMGNEIERAGYCRRIEREAMREIPVIPLFFLNIGRVYQGNVEGVHLSALGSETVRLHRVRLGTPER